jgi:dihydrofolate synthase/folylpolyglutamate synthase
MVYKKYMVASTPFANAGDVYNWLSTFINLEKGRQQWNFSLGVMNALAEIAGHPEKCAPAFHVAGSKGKGSVTGMIAAILEAAGIKTARYASPHVSDFRERITIGGIFFKEEIYTLAGKELMELAGKSKLKNDEKMSYFELFTMWFFLCARLSRCNAMAVETGMGGRLDATNILDPAASVITLIELEHTEYLGNTIAAVAGEKAGIIKQGRPLVLAEQSEEALEVFREHAERRGSPMFYFPDCGEVKNTRVEKSGTTFDLVIKNETIAGLFVPIPGEVQANNAGLAALAVKTVFPDLQNRCFYKGFKGCSLPARFERISSAPLFIIDGAHTKNSVKTCVDTFTSLYGGGGILLFACAEGKDVLSMAELCVHRFSRIIITKPGTFKKSNAEEIYAAFVQTAESQNVRPEITFLTQTEEAVDSAIRLAVKDGLPVLGTGSFYLAGEIRGKVHESYFSGMPAIMT